MKSKFMNYKHKKSDEAINSDDRRVLDKDWFTRRWVDAHYFERDWFHQKWVHKYKTR
jgi:hypothetical protein